MKILLIGPYGLGNTILSLPAILKLRSIRKTDQIDFVSLLPSISSLMEIFDEFKVFDKVYNLDLNSKTGLLKEIYNIRKEKYDYSVLMFPSARIHYNLISFFMGAEKRIGSLYPDVNFKRGAFLNNINIPVKIGIHDVYQNLRLLEPFGIKTSKADFHNVYAKISLKRKKKIIGIHPGSKKAGYFKKWNKDNYIRIVNKILKETDYKVKIFFGPDEIEDLFYFRNILKGRKRVDIIADKSLKEVVDNINQCKIFLSNDSGLMHLANFLGCYNIVLNGPSDFRRTGPMNKPYKLIYNNKLNCIPCSHTYMVKSHKFNCIYGDIRCMKSIKVEDVWKELKKKL